ncbi:glycosyltransferase family 4 protein [Gillisia hiemivivida]|uniref:Glycosyltransferase family 4 protein n=1 Tax=Gillisia hiemivivida TaxID=291190 RepID=A0A5C6ZUL0_9FLAO|nr:glycosyltransferase family 4 protein [Gillisia hiemivivida]TXD93894.1 glycosyltransferase family 4 protein [Gillisia hiemivivida]
MKPKSYTKILVVAESIDLEDSSGSKANVALIQNLHKAGFEVLVYHYTRKEIQLPGITCMAIKEKRWSVLFFLSRMERYIRSFLKLSLSKPLEKVFGFSFTLFNDRNSIVAALQEMESFKPDLVLTLSKGGSFRPHHALLKMPELHNKWMAYIHDPYPMHFYPKPYTWTEAGARQKEEFMKEVALKAKITAFPSKLLMEWMGSHFAPYQTKGVVVPHQLEHGNNDEVNEELPYYFKNGNFNLVHAGNLLWGRDPNGLILGFQKFLKENPSAKRHARLIFLGGANHYSSELSEYEREIYQFKVSTDYLPFKMVQKIQKRSSVNVILEAKSTISPFLPGKFPHCVSANKPILILGPGYSECRRLLGEDYIYWAEIDEVDKIARLIDNFYCQWKNDPNKLKLNRPDLIEYLSINYLAETMNKIFEE